jgi:hypothetical protein
MGATIEVVLRNGRVLRVFGTMDAEAMARLAADLGGVITLPAGARVLLATQPVDFRKGHMAWPPWRRRCWARIRSRAR